MKGEYAMCEALRDLFKDEIEAEKEDAKRKGRAEGRAEGELKQAKKTAFRLAERKITIVEIAEIIGVSEDIVKKWLENAVAVEK
jgi:predicted transposase YdaD